MNWITNPVTTYFRIANPKEQGCDIKKAGMFIPALREPQRTEFEPIFGRFEENF